MARRIATNRINGTHDALAMQSGIDIHPAAELFPLLKGDAFTKLVEDIRENGLSEPIQLLDGKVLDGRNRLLACTAADVVARFEELPEDTDPIRKVVSLNIKRRQLKPSQLSMIAAKIANMKEGRQEGGDRRRQLHHRPQRRGRAHRLRRGLPVYIGERNDLRDLSLLKVRRALRGVVEAAQADPERFNLPKAFADMSFKASKLGEALRHQPVVRVVRWIVETVPDDGLYKHVVAAQICAEIYSDHGEARGEKIVEEMAKQIADDVDPISAWESQLNKQRNRPTNENLLKKGRNVVKDIAKAL